MDNEDTAKYELQMMWNDEEFKHCNIWLIFANKQECSEALSVTEIENILELDELQKTHKNRKFHIQGCCGENFEGVDEGMDWLVAQLRNN